MTEKIYLDDHNQAAFKCPKCEKTWTKDLSGFKDIHKRIQLKCKCPCGHTFPVIQERRREFRKTVSVTGAYFHSQREIRGLITVKSISKSGVGLLLSTRQNIHTGDKLQLKFNLDDPKKSFVDKEGIVKKIEDNYLVLQFTDDIWHEDLKGYFLDK